MHNAYLDLYYDRVNIIREEIDPCFGTVRTSMFGSRVS